MSKHEDAFSIQLPLADCLLCSGAVAGLNWRIMEQGEDYIICKEQVPGLGFTNPVTIEIVLRELPPGQTSDMVVGSNLGFGPIQGGHVRGQVGNLKNRVQVVASRSTASTGTQATGDLADELKKLADLHTQGVLTDKEFTNAKARLLNDLN